MPEVDSVHRPADANRRMPSLCIFHPIWVLGGGLPRGLGHNLLLCSFPASAAQKGLSLSPLRGALPKAIKFVPSHDGYHQESPEARSPTKNKYRSLHFRPNCVGTIIKKQHIN